MVLTALKDRSPTTEKWLEGVPTVLVHDGRLIEAHCREALLDEGDVLAAARGQQGLVGLDQIRYAVLEVDGTISIIPRSSTKIP